MAEEVEAPMQATGYVRVSTDEQGRSGLGLDAQRQSIEAECERRGWQLAEVIEDVGYSGKSLKRPGIQSALGKLKAGESNVLVVAKLDRLSRAIKDFADVMVDASKQGWALVALDLDVDTTTPMGEAMTNVMVSFAQYERRIIGQRTKDALAAKREKGERLGSKRRVPDEVVERIARERDAGATFRAIAAGLDRDGIPTARGGRKWWPSTIEAMLASAAYEAELATAARTAVANALG